MLRKLTHEQFEACRYPLIVKQSRRAANLIGPPTAPEKTGSRDGRSS